MGAVAPPIESSRLSKLRPDLYPMGSMARVRWYMPSTRVRSASGHLGHFDRGVSGDSNGMWAGWSRSAGLNFRCRENIKTPEVAHIFKQF